MPFVPLSQPLPFDHVCDTSIDGLSLTLHSNAGELSSQEPRSTQAPMSHGQRKVAERAAIVACRSELLIMGKRVGAGRNLGRHVNLL
jgi:hypothetical protein